MLVVKNKSSVMMPVVKTSTTDHMFYNNNNSTSNYLDDLILSEGHNSSLFDINNTLGHENLANMDDIDDLEDLEDLDDLDDDDDEEDSDDSAGGGDSDEDDDACSSTSCSSLNNSSTASPSSLTTTNTNGSYSSCSTPSKSKHNKKANNGGSGPASVSTIVTGGGSKKSKKNQNQGGGVMTLAKQARNSRFNSMGYSSDNPAEKRAFHILSERQRRNDLKKLFETLRVNIPTLGDKQKASKLTILKAAVDHLCEVGNRRERLHSHFEKEKLRNAQLLQHLKSLQNEVGNNSNNNSQMSYAPSGFTLINSTHCQSQMATLAVH